MFFNSGASKRSNNMNQRQQKTPRGTMSDSVAAAGTVSFGRPMLNTYISARHFCKPAIRSREGMFDVFEAAPLTYNNSATHAFGRLG